MRVLRALVNYAAARFEDGHGRPILTDNPTKRLSATRTWYRVDRRRTVIKPHQLTAWMQAVLTLSAERSGGKVEVVRDYLLLLLFTGLRREEAARLRWADVDLGCRTLIIRDTKNRHPHELPLSDFLCELLARRRALAGDYPYVFPSESKKGYVVEPQYWIDKIAEQSGVSFMIHDLRRTFVTIAESLDIPAYALKRLLNHKAGADVTAGYLVIDTERLRDPMQRISEFILKAAGVKPSAPVVAFPQSARP